MMGENGCWVALNTSDSICELSASGSFIAITVGYLMNLSPQNEHR